MILIGYITFQVSGNSLLHFLLIKEQHVNNIQLVNLALFVVLYFLFCSFWCREKVGFREDITQHVVL
uniref:Uncharacterized protein n=1 Tax=Rhizophora mucronata TaxID=61149 RepID=A0A2P2PIH2_RHIMU